MGQWWGAKPPRIGGVLVAAAGLVVLGALQDARGADPGDDGLIDPPPRAEEPAVTTKAAPKTAPGSAVIANFPDQIDVPAGQSVIVRLRRPAQRVAIAEPEVADVVLVSPTEI